MQGDNKNCPFLSGYEQTLIVNKTDTTRMINLLFFSHKSSLCLRMCIFCSTFVGEMGKMRSYRIQQACRMFCVVGVLCVVLCGLCSCGWKGAQEVIATAERMDKTEHVVYDDTTAIAGVIRKLDNPLGRILYRNTLGKAYYYMGRNLEDNHQKIAKAAQCYIEADRLQIDDPIYRGRINVCMGYICKQSNNDSLSLFFYERANKVFQNSGNEWRYIQCLLSISQSYINLHFFTESDSLLRIVQLHQLDSVCQARYYETRGLYFYEQQQYDSALVYFNQGANYWQHEKDRCFAYMKQMQAYFNTNKVDSATYYAKKIVSTSKNSNYISNAYYCLILDAKSKNDLELLSRYSHARTDVQKSLRDKMLKYAEPLPILKEYVSNPHPWRWVWITIWSVVFIYLLSVVGTLIYRKRHRIVQESLDFENKRLGALDKYHVPHKRWRKYSLLNRDLDPWLHDWLHALDALSLSEQEKIFCALSLIYPHMTDVEIADFMCYGKDGIRVFKNRILKKLGLSSAEFSIFLRNLSISK